MVVTKENSQQIAERLGAILHKNINIMNANGSIVASTDPARIDTLHQAAKDLIDQNAPEMDVYSRDHLSGSKEGINLPLRIRGQTVGVIGITGNPDELRDIGLVIMEMAEILFTETFQDQERNEKMRQQRHFLETLLFGNPSALSETFLQQGELFGISANKIKTIAVLSFPNDISVTPRASAYETLLSSLQARLTNTILRYHLHLGEKLILCLGLDSKEYLLLQLSEAIKDARIKSNIPIYCGISGGCQSPLQIHQIYTQADTAFRLAYNSHLNELCLYENLVLELFLGQLTKESKLAFLQRVWNTADEFTCLSMLEFLRAYFDCDGSIQRIAAQLFIHKNTVQYRIQKISDLTGYDPRHAADAAVLYLAVKISQMI